MRIYIDGYNLLFRFSKKTTLEKTRSTLISSLNQLAIQLKLNMIVVFDATYQSDRLGIVRSNYDALEIVYTENQSADTYILEEIEHAPSPSQIMLITSDRELAHKAKQRGARSQTIHQFIEWMKHKKAQKNSILLEEKGLEDSPLNIHRLLKIFEERLKMQ